MIALTATVAEQIDSIAHELARKHKLEADGTIWCWHCSSKPALMPSLACPMCLAEAWRRAGIVIPECPNRLQTPADVEAAKCR